jgi:PncC family amidohydrolase
MAQLGWTLATAESCTGGTIASMITEVAGSSAYFKGSVVSYAVEVKERLLGVDVSDGVVSESTARQMAEGVARVLRTDCAVATTGVAGPGGGTPENPVGTVWMAATAKGKTVAQCYHFVGDREAVILQAADAALRLLWQLIENETEKSIK